VGEMRDPETMRLTLSAAETGHLVLATVHSANCAEALQRVVGAFPAEIQSNVAAQLADCLIGVISQRLQFRPNLSICVPECEVLTATFPIRNYIRNRDFFKIISSVETGAEHGMWSFQRYRAWLDKRTQFHVAPREPDLEEEAPAPAPAMEMPPRRDAAALAATSAKPATTEDSRIEIEPTEIFEKILKRPD
jgi:twitching motility protein PilT